MLTTPRVTSSSAPTPAATAVPPPAPTPAAPVSAVPANFSFSVPAQQEDVSLESDLTDSSSLVNQSSEIMDTTASEKDKKEQDAKEQTFDCIVKLKGCDFKGKLEDLVTHLRRCHDRLRPWIAASNEVKQHCHDKDKDVTKCVYCLLKPHMKK